MAGEQMGKIAQDLGNKIRKETAGPAEQIAKKMSSSGMMPKELLGLNDAMIEGIYGQAYRLYNTGKYREAGQLFRLLVMLNATEAKYAMGLAACLHMIKDLKAAVEAYMLCSVIDPQSPIPHYHASDCYIQMKDRLSAVISLELAARACGDKQEYKTLKDRAQMTILSLKKEIENDRANPKAEGEGKIDKR